MTCTAMRGSAVSANDQPSLALRVMSPTRFAVPLWQVECKNQRSPARSSGKASRRAWRAAPTPPLVLAVLGFDAEARR
jgi:hypothetical protein